MLPEGPRCSRRCCCSAGLVVIRLLEMQTRLAPLLKRPCWIHGRGEYPSARGVEGTRRIESAHPWKLSPRPWGVLPKESWMVKRGDWFRKHRVPGCCSGRRRNSHSCPMARHGFRLGPTPCRSHASAMPIGVGRHHQTNQSQTKDLTERIADALVSAMCLCIFGKAKRKRL